MKYYLSFFLTTLFFSVNAQEDVVIENLGLNEFKFLSVDSPLTQIAGAPEPFYTYWWEFGDGHFSTEIAPNHRYTKKGNYNLFLSRTNNYDDGPTRPNKKKIVNASSENVEASLIDKPSYIDKSQAVFIQKNRNPKPKDEVTFVETYQNTSINKQSGTLLFFYNEKNFLKDHFLLADYRNYFGEKEIVITNKIIQEKLSKLESNLDMSSNILDNNLFNDYMASTESESIETALSVIAKNKLSETKSYDNLKEIQKEVSTGFANYKDVIAFEFNDLNPGEQRNVFISLLTSESMLEDTSVTISVQSIFIPDEYSYTQKYKHLMPIVTAHDPNKLLVNLNETTKKYVKKNGLEYEIKFQNVGKGPAEEIKLRFYNNAEIKIEDIEILEIKPDCQVCKFDCVGSRIDTTFTDEYVEFYFHDIYLPGKKQADLEDKSATKGFVKFKLNTQEKIKKNNFTCKTEIYFDREKPIRTNHAITSFQKKMFIGLESGMIYLPASFPRFEWFIRGNYTLNIADKWTYSASLSPQYEAEHISVSENIIDTTFITRSFGYSANDPDGVRQTINPEDSLTGTYYRQILKNDFEIKRQSVSLEIVPFEFSREITEYFSLGFGFRTKVNLAIFEKTNSQIDEENYIAEVSQFFEFELIPATNNYTVVNHRLSDPIYVNQSNTKQFINTDYQQKEYQIDASTGLFVDINIGRIHNAPYFGTRLNLDYQISTQKFNPNFQFYLGANF